MFDGCNSRNFAKLLKISSGFLNNVDVVLLIIYYFYFFLFCVFFLLFVLFFLLFLLLFVLLLTLLFFIVVDVVVGFLNQNHFFLDLFPVSPYIQENTTMFAVCLRRSLRTQLRCFQAHCVYAPCNMHLMYRCIPMTGSQELS